MVQGSNCAGGVCAVVGRRDAELALALAKQGSFVVQSLYTSAESCDRARDVIRGQGSYGIVSAGLLEGGRLPYTDNLVNILVVDDVTALQQRGLSIREVARVLAPLGTAYLAVASDAPFPNDWIGQSSRLGLERISPAPADNWVQLRKAWPAQIDQWTHYLHGADGNPVARDAWWLRRSTTSGLPVRCGCGATRPIPASARWSPPQAGCSPSWTRRRSAWPATTRCPTSGSWSPATPSTACCLWKVPIRRWGWREWKETWFTNRPGDFPLNIQKRLVAVGDKVYVTLGYQAPVSQLDARTGEILQTYAGTERTNEILCLDGTLDPVRARRTSSVRVMAVDAASGRRRSGPRSKPIAAPRSTTSNGQEMNGRREAAEAGSVR